jgi:hypothetical protein
MTDRPILFSAEMVRAILDGRKTQTRRVMKPQPKPTPADFPGPAGHWWPSQKHKSMLGVEREMQKWKGLAGSACPYGDTGDLLWVREGFAVQPELWADNHGPQPIHYTADQVIGFAGKPDQRQIEDYRSKPSIHMPRWASRITLRITDIRVERLRDISEDDAKAEGVSSEWDDYEKYGQSEPYRYGFSALWNDINGPNAWDANPWVWVVAFERVEP